jgi:hypothetical protein
MGQSRNRSATCGSAFRRGWEGEGKLNRRPGAGQQARSDRHTGVTILLWEREGKALGVPAYKQTEPVRLQRSQELEAISLPKSPRGKTTAPLQGAKPAGRSAPGPVGQRTSGHERCKSASGSANKRRSLESVRSQCSTLKSSRSTGYLLFHAPDRNPEGQDYRLGSRQRIEQVAVR